MHVQDGTVKTGQLATVSHKVTR